MRFVTQAAVAASIALLSPLLAQAAPAPDPDRAEFDALVDDIIGAKSEVDAQALAHYARRFEGRVPRAAVLGGLERARDRTPHEGARADLTRQIELVHQASGRWDEAGARPTDALGCLERFSLVGPFANESMEGFEVPGGPEIGESGPYDGSIGPVSWRPLPPFSTRCVLNVDRAIAPAEDALVYLAGSISLKKSAPNARLLIGAAGHYKVWLDGRLIAERDHDPGFAFDAEAWAVPLKKGSHDILIKLASSSDSGLDLTARLIDRRGAPLAFAMRPDWTGRPVKPASIERPGPLGVGGVAAARAAASSDDPARSTRAAWLWRALARAEASTPWRDVAERVDRAVDKGQGLGQREHLLLAELFEEPWKRIEILERAQRAYPDDPHISASLADEYARGLDEAKRYDARAIYESVLARYPRHTSSLLGLSDWWEGAGLERRALATLRDAYPGLMLEAPPRIRGAAIGLLERLGQRAVARTIREAVEAGPERVQGEAWREERRARETNDQAAIEAVAGRESARRPYARSWVETRIDALRALGRSSEALAAAKAWLEWAPGDVTMREVRAELLEASGDRAGAVSELERALRVRPQDQDLREKIAEMSAGSERFYEPWMYAEDALRALGEQTEAGPFDASTLLDQTIVRVAENGLSQSVVQRVVRANTPEGIGRASVARIGFQSGDERVEILRVRVLKPDGSVSEDYDTWHADQTRKQSTTYNDAGTVTVRANHVDPSDLVEIRYRVAQIANQNFRGDYFGDIEYLQGSEPIARARYAVLWPDSFGDLYFRPPSLPHERLDDALPSGESPEEGWRSASFELDEVPYVKSDPDQPGYTDVYDYILVSNKETHGEIGAWWWNLVREQLVVDDAIRQTVARITEGLATDDEKLRAIHNYVVQNTRYLHVGLGIHGWKPYRTSTCLRNRYGDCKDKAALLKVMLEQAGIPAQLVLVRTRRLGAVDARPASMNIFNHAIAYVPSFNLYLDGTAEFNGSRELTSMDQGAQALIIEDGGRARWVTLPVDEPRDNLVERSLTVDLRGEEPTIALAAIARGADAVSMRTSLEDPERRDENLERGVASSFPGASLLEANYSDLRALERPVEVSARLRGGRVVREGAGRRYLYPLGTKSELVEKYAAEPARDQDLSLRVPLARRTKVRYLLPPGVSAQLPESAGGAGGAGESLPFGSYSIRYASEPGAIVVETSYEIAPQRVPVEHYQAFRSFLTEIDDALNAPIELSVATR